MAFALGPVVIPWASLSGRGPLLPPQSGPSNLRGSPCSSSRRHPEGRRDHCAPPPAPGTATRYAPSPVHSGNPSTLGHRVVPRQRVRGLACSSNRFDDLDELVPSVALAPGELHQIPSTGRSEEHTSELQSLRHLV